VTENSDDNRVVRAFAQEEKEKDKFEKHNADFRDTSCGNALIVAKYQHMLETASQFLVIITLVVGGWFLIKEWMTLGQYMAFSSWANALTTRLSSLFSVTAVPKSVSFFRNNWKRGRMRLLNLPLMYRIKGAAAHRQRASRQLTNRKNVKVETNNATESTSW
jgi:ABC-type multidrug transport system fused ATPase/permease subunit